ncbi:hypothetical protein KIPB_011397, partial [Kipferlia bialata]
AKHYEAALELYNEAYETCDQDHVFQLNAASCLLRLKRYEDAKEMALAAHETAQKIRASFEVLGKTLCRAGVAAMRGGDLEGAVKLLRQSMTEHREKTALESLRKAEKALKVQRETEYINPELAVVAKNEGNALFKEGDFPAAIEKYSDAIKRDPTVSSFHTNRAFAYFKLGEWQSVEDDCEAALAKDPANIKAHIRLGKTHMLRKQYHKALEAYNAALKLDPQNAEALEGMQKTYGVMGQRQTPEDQQARMQAAMQDPEIMAILQDPGMSQVLQALQTDPAGAQKFMNDPSVMAKIQKLIAAGVLA